MLLPLRANLEMRRSREAPAFVEEGSGVRSRCSQEVGFTVASV
jgi:hypothetical protein